MRISGRLAAGVAIATALDDELRFDEVNLVVDDRAGRRFVVDTTNRLFVLDCDGTLLHTFAATAPGARDIEFGPIAIDGDGQIYLTDLSASTDACLIIGQLGARPDHLQPSSWPTTAEAANGARLQRVESRPWTPTT